MAGSGADKALMKALEWVVDVNVPALRGEVDALRAAHPDASNRHLAKTVFGRARWKATAAGVATSLPANPWVAGPAALADVSITVKTEVLAAAKVALLYRPEFFDDDEAVWELLIPVLGLNTGGKVAKEFAVRGGMGVTRVAIKKYLSKGTLKQFKKVLLKYFGLKVTQKGVITKTLPVVGGLIGGVWNWAEVSAIRSRTISYLEG